MSSGARHHAAGHQVRERAGNDGTPRASSNDVVVPAA